MVLILRSTLEYCSEMWACNKQQTASLESFQLRGAKKIHIVGCSSGNEAIMGDMRLESLKDRRGVGANIIR